MKSKKIVLAMFALFVLVLSFSAVSASVFEAELISVPENVSHDAGSFNVRFNISYGGDSDSIDVSFDDSSISEGATIVLSNTTLGKDETKVLDAVINFDAFQNGNIIGTIVADPDAGSAPNVELDFSVEILDELDLELVKVDDLTMSENGSFKIKNNGNVILNSIDLIADGDFAVDLSVDSVGSIMPGEESSEIVISLVESGEFDFGDNSISVTATSDEDATDSLNFIIEGSFCDAGEQGSSDFELELKDVSIDNNGEGSDDEWVVLDEIKVEVEVENVGDEDVEDVILELALFDSSGENYASDLEFLSDGDEEYDLGDVDEGEEETFTFTFRVPADFDEGNYRLALKAYGDEEGEENVCTAVSSDFSDDKYESISVERESDEERFIAFENIEITPIDLTCGDRVAVSVDVFNIGDEEQERILVKLYSDDLNVAEEYEITNDMDKGDKETVLFYFDVPQGIEDKAYSLKLDADYDYKNGVYRETLENSHLFPVRVVGCAPVSDRIANIGASLESDAVAGEQLTVKVVVSNLKEEQSSFVLSVKGLDSWAVVDSVTPNSFVLGSGQTQEVEVVLNVNDEVSGENSFVVEVISGEDSESREVAVMLEESQGFSLEGNSLIWVIGAVNLILIILIIIVAIRLSRR